MKIQIDTVAKTLKLDEAVRIDELINLLEAMLPSGRWKEFDLITNVTVNWTNTPIVIRDYPVYPRWPWYDQPFYTTGGLSYDLNPGVYDVQF
jgi:hypothetical protein